ncbi:MAG: histidine--tRNA ligase, partial [Magnetospirillum sp.]|nr:histidine--tRNA ligase [Magnetospirillum sp.]
GVERLSMLVQGVPEPDRPVSIVPMGDVVPALVLADRLRAAGLCVDLGFSGNMKKRMARAVKANARFAIILGEDEMARGAVTLRDLDAGSQEEVPLAEVEARLVG